jgi:predicted amidohydrolase YtcJ
MLRLAGLVACAGLTLAGAAQRPDRPPDVILINGRIVTMDPGRPGAEAIAVRDGRVLFVGTTGQVSTLKGPSTRTIDLRDRTVVPGFVDGHLRFAALADGDQSSAPLQDRISRSVQLALSYGVTGAHDMGATLETIEAYKALVAAGKFPFRINAYPTASDASGELDRILAAGRYEDAGARLQVRGVHVSIDGALADRGAALTAPYSDDPSTTGGVRVTKDQLLLILEKSLKARFTVAIDAVGDRANQIALDAIQEALARVPVKDHRIRVEHAQVLRPADVPRFVELGVLVSWPWIRCTLDMPWAEKRIGPERMATAYAWRTILSTGARIVGGSDEGAKTFSPFMGIHAAVTRQDARGKPDGGWYPAQRLTREEALRSYTADAAYAAFQEVRAGMLAPGRLADLAVLSRDITTVSPADILRTETLLTMVGGEVVFDRTTSKPGR